MSIKAVAWAYAQKCGTPAEKLVLITLCDYANDQNGLCAWPSQASISDKCEMSDRHLRRIVSSLIEKGFVSVEHRFDQEGRQQSSIYRISAPRVDSHVRGEVDSGVHGEVDSHVLHNRKIEPLDRTKDSCASPSQERREREREFEEIWKLFPRKVSKGHALKAYISARKQTSFETIRAAVDRHREQCAGHEPQFIPHPATWLNGKRWLDDEPTGDNVFSFSRGPRMSYEEALREEAKQR